MNEAKAEERVIRVTKSPCPSCRKLVRAEMVLRGESLFLRKICEEDGIDEVLYRRDFRFYDDLCKIVHCVDRNNGSSNNGSGNGFKVASKSKVGIVGIDLTDRCNLDCPVCLADAGEDGPHCPSAQDIAARLKDWNGHRPVIYLMGGEPTLRVDLPDIVRTLLARRFSVVLLTNGLKMADKSYARTLHDAGLRFVSFQFDGLSDDIYEKLRGRKLLDLKMAALKNLTELGFRTSFSVVLAKGINDHQVSDIIRLAVGMEGVTEVDFLPARSLGRDTLGIESHNVDVEHLMDSIDAGTGGRIRRNDFITSMKTMNTIHKLTKLEQFRQRLCRFTLPVIGDQDNFYPALRYANPLMALGNPKSFSTVKYMLGNLFSLYAHRDFPRELTFVSITDFYDMKTLNTTDTGLCNAAYMTKDGYVPGCVYNTLFRRNCLV